MCYNVAFTWEYRLSYDYLECKRSGSLIIWLSSSPMQEDRQFMAMDSKFESGLTAAGPQLWHIYLICTRRRHTRGILIIWLCSFISTQKNTVLKQILLQNADYLRSPVAYLIRLSSISKRQTFLSKKAPVGFFARSELAIPVPYIRWWLVYNRRLELWD